MERPILLSEKKAVPLKVNGLKAQDLILSDVVNERTHEKYVASSDRGRTAKRAPRSLLTALRELGVCVYVCSKPPPPCRSPRLRQCPAPGGTREARHLPLAAPGHVAPLPGKPCGGQLGRTRRTTDGPVGVRWKALSFRSHSMPRGRPQGHPQGVEPWGNLLFSQVVNIRSSGATHVFPQYRMSCPVTSFSSCLTKISGRQVSATCLCSETIFC